MLPSTVTGLLVCVVAFSTLVVADPTTVITGRTLELTQTPSDHFGSWSVQMEKGKKNSLFTIIMPTKKEMPATMRFKFNVQLSGQPPMEYEISLCEALDDPVIGKSLVKAGLPKGQFPSKCPFTAGDWSIMKWDPPATLVPPGSPDGPVTASLELSEEGKEAYIKMNFQGDLSHAIPGFGR